MAPRDHVAWRFAQPLRPENGRRIEHEVTLRPRINRRRPVLRMDAALEGSALGNDFQTVDLGRIAMVFPTDKPWNTVTLFHASAFEDPMVRLRANPIATTIHRNHVDGSHELPFIRAWRNVFEPHQVIKFLLPRQPAIRRSASDSAIRLAVG